MSEKNLAQRLVDQLQGENIIETANAAGHILGVALASAAKTSHPAAAEVVFETFNAALQPYRKLSAEGEEDAPQN